MKLPFLLLTFAFLAWSSPICTDLDEAFKTVVEANEEAACNCMPNAFNKKLITIGCTRQNMPSIFKALNAINETPVDKIEIWNSLLNIVPTEIFSKIQAKSVMIENSGVSVFRKGVFANLGEQLRQLNLRNNILKTIDNDTFAEITKLTELDLSGNKLTTVKSNQFSALENLEILQLSNNQIEEIADNSFVKLKKLQSLYLSHNKLTKITRNTFKGLTNLKTLYLEGNHISSIDVNAFNDLKKLEYINLGSNLLTKLELSALPNLKTLFLNDNNLQSIKNVDLKNSPMLQTLNLDKNNIVQITDSDTVGISNSPRLQVLSLGGNGMAHIDANAFNKCKQLTSLVLHYNNITSLSSVPKGGNGAVSWLKPLNKLETIYLSWNQIASLKTGELNAVRMLKTVTMDHNKLGTIDKDALSGLQLKKLFLNGNDLYYLPEGIFQGWDVKKISLVDLADNPWECICGHEWIGEWLRSLDDRSTPSGNVGCLAYHCGNEVEETPKHSAWITVAAGILAFVALLFMAAIAYLYIQESCLRSPIPLKRMPSDMIRLIPSLESLSFPNPLAGELKPNKGAEGTTDDNKEKKRVRFDGV